jgi:hypothetical protein
VDWLQWQYEGVGVLITLLALGYTALIFWQRDDRRLMTIASVGVLFAALSTRTSLSLGAFEVGSLAEYARFVMPGVRFFQRAALITEAVMCVLAVLAIHQLARNIKSDVGRQLVGGVIFRPGPHLSRSMAGKRRVPAGCPSTRLFEAFSPRSTTRSSPHFRPKE